jgi:hypothetical protein
MFMSHSPIRKKIKEIVTYYDRNFDLTLYSSSDSLVFSNRSFCERVTRTEK